MKDHRVYLLHVRDAIQYIQEYTVSGREAFFGDRKTQDAVIRNLQIIGEAVKQGVGDAENRTSGDPLEANWGHAG